MSKAMLIMDMPSSCPDCPCLNRENYKCQKTEKYLGCEEGVDDRPIWCPLRECPTKKERNFDTLAELYEIIGYNACIDEILGGGE
jgi:hypothetical protein